MSNNDYPGNLEEENSRLKQENKILQEQYEALKQSNDNVLKRLSLIEERSKSQQSPATIPSTTKVQIQKPDSSNSSLSLADEIAELKKEIIASNASIIELQDGCSKSAAKLSDHEERLHHHDQYSRLNSLFIKGLLDIPSKTYGLEFSKYVLKKLQEILPSIADKIKIDDIDASHPMSSDRDNKSCVIVKFVRRDIRNLVFFQKRELKKLPYKVVIVEHLTGRNLWYLKEARSIVGFHNVWSSQCVVYALVHDKKISVRCNKDLMFVYNYFKEHYRSYANAASGGELNSAPAANTVNADNLDATINA